MKNNRGVTLVELLVTVAILSVVLLIAMSFMTTGSRTFAEGNAEAKVQKEAELAVNQMEDMIIDVNGGVDWVKDDVTGDRELILYNAGGDSGVVEYTKESIIYKKSEHKILCSKWDMVFDTAANEYKIDSPRYTDQLLAENVTQFEADISDVYTDTTSDGTTIDIVKSVQLKVGYDDGSGRAAYATSPVITLRNRMMKSDNPTAIFEETPVVTDTMKLYISDTDMAAAVPIQDGVTEVTRANVYNIYAMLVNADDGSNINNQVDWEIAEANTLSTIDSNGKLSVGTYEPNDYLTIIAKYKSNPNKKATGVVKVVGGTIKSLEGVSIITKELKPFAPKYGSIVSTIGFTTEEIAKLKYQWIIKEEDMVHVAGFADGTESMTKDILSLDIKKQQESYGKMFSITLVVTSEITGQQVSDSVLYRIDAEGTEGGDSNMKRGREEGAESEFHDDNQYRLTPPDNAEKDTFEYYFCDERGNKISALDNLKQYIIIRFTAKTQYYLTFTEGMPADSEYYVKVILYYKDVNGDPAWTYERIHYIPALQLYGETTYTSAPLNGSGVFDPYRTFDCYFNAVGYYSYRIMDKVNYEVTIDYEAPSGVTIEGCVQQSNIPGSDSRVRVQLGFQVDTGGQVLNEVVNDIIVRSAKIKITYDDEATSSKVSTYATVIFNY